MKTRIAVVSPFLDKRHGTERCVAEQLERLSAKYEFRVYAMRVEDIDPASIQLHQIPSLLVPQVFRYVWWFIANHLLRWWDVRFRGGQYDILYSPGVNCLHADIIAVHIVFAEFYRLVKHHMKLGCNPIRSWPRLIHRWLYYHMLILLERMVYVRPATQLVPVSRKVADDLKYWYGRSECLSVVYNGVDSGRFCPETCANLRTHARLSLNLDANAFAILLIGNDWKKKGLSCLLAGVESLRNPSLHVLVVGEDDILPYQGMLKRAGLSARVTFLPIRPDVEAYYAAADAYAGPSIEDAFAIPPLEAMACGIPVIVSRQAGVSEIITQGIDGFILENPSDSSVLARLLQRLYDEPELRRSVGERATRTARQYNWERNAKEMKTLFDLALKRKTAIASSNS